MMDLAGWFGRKYGSVGVAIDRPRVVVAAEPADALTADGPFADRAATFARRTLDALRLPRRAAVHVLEAIPAHVGLGSGTQLALATATAVSRLYGIEADAVTLAAATGRGDRSGIGIATFMGGGFVVDGGRRISDDGIAAPVAPIVFQAPFPDDWRFVVAIPGVPPGLHDEAERAAFTSLPVMPVEVVGRISALILIKMLPALLERDAVRFGAALTEVQAIVGDSFAAVQGGRFANARCAAAVAAMLEYGALGAGQSSWGPTVYGLVVGDEAAAALARRLASTLGDHAGGMVFVARPRNYGARVAALTTGTRGV